MEVAATVVILTCTYALLAAGIVVLYKAGRVVNFAHGELAVIAGIVIYTALMRRLVGEPFYVAILVTIGIAIVLKSAIVVIWRAQRVTIDIGMAPAVRLAGGASLSYMDISTVVLTIAFFAGLYLFLRFTRLGVH